MTNYFDDCELLIDDLDIYTCMGCGKETVIETDGVFIKNAKNRQLCDDCIKDLGSSDKTFEKIFNEVAGFINPKYYISMEKVGSRITSPAYTEESDFDILVLTSKRKLQACVNVLQRNGFTDQTQEEYELNGINCAEEGMDFRSLKNGFINVILTDSDKFFSLFILATKIAKRFKLDNKPDRVLLFQAVLYGKWSDYKK